MKTALGIVLLIIGLAGALQGPVDSEYVEDWLVWFVFTAISGVGLALIIS